MDITNYITVLPITIICYIIGLGCKQIPKIKNELIPFIVSICGGLIAIPALYLMPEFPANDIITAISIGMYSGLVSTGINQIYKQIKNLSNSQE